MNESYATLERRRKTVLKKMSQVGPSLMATPAYVKLKCGNPRCKCARDKEARHEKMQISWTDQGGESGSLYVPIGIRKEVMEWIENYWTMRDYLREMTVLSRKMIRLYARSTKRKGEKK